jgi:CRP/FNR family transcriptional regulator, cyclic AMP receptor protein
MIQKIKGERIKINSEATMHSLLEFLKTVTLFKGLPSEALSKILNSVEKRGYSSGSNFIHQGDIGNSIYIVVEGRLKATMKSKDGREKILSIFEKGQYFGELSIFGRKRRTAFITAMSKCELLMLEKEVFRNLIREYPDISFNLLDDVCDKMAETNEQLSDALFVEADDKIKKAIANLSKNAHINRDGLKCIQNITVQDLANITGVVRPTASKIIGKFKRDGYIEVMNKKITILRDGFWL